MNNTTKTSNVNSKSINSLTVLGSSSGRNAGDAMLIAGLMDAIDEATGDQKLYEIPTHRPWYIRENYKNKTRPINMNPWALSVGMLGLPTMSSINRTDMTLIFDNPLFDRSLYNPLFNYMSTIRLLLPKAKREGKKLCMYNCGGGPVHTPAGQRMLKEIADMMDFVSVRDIDSYNLLKDIGVTNPRMMITADAAVTVKPSSKERVDEILKSVGMPLDQEILAINVNKYLDTWVTPKVGEKKRESIGKEKFVATYIEAINRFVAQTNVPLLFVSTQVHDIDLTKEIMSGIKTKAPIGISTNEKHNHYDMKGVLSRVALTFGMRLHCSILSSSALTPTIGIEFQKKVRSYYQSIGLGDYCFSFDDFSVDNLYNHIAKGWEDRKKLRAHLEVKIPEIQKIAVRPARVIAEMDKGNDIGKFWEKGFDWETEGDLVQRVTNG